MFFAAVLALVTSFQAPPVARAELFRPLTFDAALAAAQQEKRVVMIDFFTTWCGPCKKLDATTWKDESVLAWARETLVPIKLDAEREVELARRFRVDSYPTLVFVRPDGAEIDRTTGYLNAADFLTEAKALLAGRDAITRLREQLAVREKDFSLRGKLAAALAQRGEHAEALTEYLRCFDEGRDNAAYGGVRLSFLLSDLQRLGKDYPPALRALEERRDAAEQRVLAHPVEEKPKMQALAALTNDTLDCISINMQLGTPERTLTFLDRLLERGRPPTPVRTVLLPIVLEPLREARRYADLLFLVDSPSGYLRDALKRNAMIDAIDTADESATAEEHADDARQRERRKQRSVKECSAFVEALYATPERKPDGDALAEQLIKFSPTPNTFAQLAECAARAGTLDVARTFVTRGAALAPEDAATRRDLEEALARGQLAAKNAAAKPAPK